MQGKCLITDCLNDAIAAVNLPLRGFDREPLFNSSGQRVTIETKVCGDHLQMLIDLKIDAAYRDAESRDPTFKCWADRYQVQGYIGNDPPATCQLLRNHAGPHEWTSDDDIATHFLESDPWK